MNWIRAKKIVWSTFVNISSLTIKDWCDGYINADRFRELLNKENILPIKIVKYKPVKIPTLSRHLKLLLVYEDVLEFKY